MGPPDIPKRGSDQARRLIQNLSKKSSIWCYFVLLRASIPEMVARSVPLLDWLWDLIPQGKIR
jgi:hypothetical protein